MPAAGIACPICEETAPRTRDPPFGGGKHAASAELGSIGSRYSQSMPLDEPHSRRVDTRGAISAADRSSMALGARGREPAAAPVAGQAGPLDHGIDSIAVALGVAQPLENHNANPLSGNEAIRVGRERTRRSRTGEHAELAEDERKVDIGLDVDAPHQRQVRATLAESPTRQVQGDERRGAGRVDNKAGTSQIESIGKPSGCCVGELPGDRCGLERRQTRLQVLAQKLEIPRRPFRMKCAASRPTVWATTRPC